MYVNNNFSPTAAGQVLINHMQPYNGRSHYLTISNGAGGSISPSRGVLQIPHWSFSKGPRQKQTVAMFFDHWVLDGLKLQC